VMRNDKDVTQMTRMWRKWQGCDANDKDVTQMTRDTIDKDVTQMTRMW